MKLRACACVILWFFNVTSIYAEERQMVDVGGYKLDMVHHGSGGPLLVFLHGAGPDFEVFNSWITKFDTAALWYSRAGYGKSEKAPDDRKPLDIISELHSLLTKLELKPPFVLVGASLGGLYARAYAMKYPDEVAGIVFIDSSHEAQQNTLERVRGSQPSKETKKTKTNSSAKTPTIPAVRAEIAGLREISKVEKLDVDGPLPDIPMAVLTSVKPQNNLGPDAMREWRALHAKIFSATTYGLHMVTNRSGHVINKDEPHQVELAIRWVLEAVRTQGKAPATRDN